MFFDSKDLKSNFLQKKNKEKKKIQQTQQQNTNVIKVQKNIRGFLERNRLIKQLFHNHDVLHLLLMKSQINDVSVQQLKKVKDQLLSVLLVNHSQQQNSVSTFYLFRLFFALIKNLQTCHLSYQMLEQIILSSSKEFISELVKSQKLMSLINAMIREKSGTKLLNLLSKFIYQEGRIDCLDKSRIFELLIEEFEPSKIEVENPHSQIIAIQNVVLLLNSLYYQKYTPEVNFKYFEPLSNLVRKLLILDTYYFKNMPPIQPAINYLISLILFSIEYEQRSLVQQISKEYNHLLVLMEDQEDLTYFENKILSHQKVEAFSTIVLKVMQEIFESPKIVKMFFDKQRQESRLIKQVMIRSIKMLSQMFEDRKILFLRSLLSSNQLLVELSQKKRALIL